MEQSVFCRRSKPVVVKDPESGSPFALDNYSVVVDELGNTKCEITAPVAPSLASEFDVISNSMRNRMGSPIFTRESFDPVDFPEKHPEFFND